MKEEYKCNHEHFSRVCNTCGVDLVHQAEQEMLKSIYDYLYTHRTADNDEIVFVKFNKKDFLSLSSLDTLTDNE